MIEIEKKFIINNEIKDRLVSDAEFIYRKIFTDTYYDNDSFSLTTKDIWLRSREGKFELKLPMSIRDKMAINQYKEIEDEESIKQLLKLDHEDILSNVLQANGYAPFCSLTTVREKYKKGNFLIDIDTVSAENFSYSIAEIELMIEEQSEMELALNQMGEFMTKNNISENPVRGKVIEYIRQNNSHHFNALLSVGVIKN